MRAEPAGGARALTVGVVGTGRMGSAMSTALARAGYWLLLYNRTPERARELAASLGARALDTAAAVARESDLLITMLADGAAVEAVYRQRDGILDGLSARTVALDMSTVPPRTVRALAAPVRERGAAILDAPVSGSTSTAEAGDLTIMVGGDAADLERARPVLEALSQRIFHMGPLGTAAAMKLAVNALIFGLNGALAEGLVIAERAGIDRALAYDVLASSVAGGPFVQYKRDSFVDPERTPVAFALDLAEKDLRLITALAADLGVRAEQAETNLRIHEEAAANGRHDRDLSHVAVHLREAAANATVRSTAEADQQAPAGSR